MTGTELTSLAKDIVKYVNLVAFDICDVDHVKVSDTASPLVKRVTAPLTKDVPQIAQAPLRKMIKKSCKSRDTLAGAIKLNAPYLDVVIYLKRRVTPAWLIKNPEDSQTND